MTGLAIDDLRQLFEEAFSGDTISDSGALYRFAAEMARVFHNTRGPLRVGAFALHSVFLALADAIDGEPLEVTKARELYRSLYAPSEELLDQLTSSPDESKLFAAILALLDGYAPPPSLQS